jgi:hypothetical protein
MSSVNIAQAQDLGVDVRHVRVGDALVELARRGARLAASGTTDHADIAQNMRTALDEVLSPLAAEKAKVTVLPRPSHPCYGRDVASAEVRITVPADDDAAASRSESYHVMVMGSSHVARPRLICLR